MSSTWKIILTIAVTALVVGIGTYWYVDGKFASSQKTVNTNSSQAVPKNGDEDLRSLENNDSFNLKEINEYMLAGIKSVFSTAQLISAGASPDHSVTDSSYPPYGQKAIMVYTVSRTITDADFTKISSAIAALKITGSSTALRYEIDNPANKGILMFREAGGSNIRLIMIPDLDDSGVHNISVFVY